MSEKKIKSKKALKKVLVLTFMLCFTALPRLAFGQQDPMYTQYMFNTQTINPAYAGSWGSFGFLVLSRMQWVGIDNAPLTNTFSFQAPTKNLKFGYGINLIQDRVGHENRLGLFADYSYAIDFDNNRFLRFGLKAGFTNYSNNLNAYTLYPNDSNDPLYIGYKHSLFMPNFGVGLHYDSERFYIGVSSPKLLNNKIENSDVNYSGYAEFRHFFLSSGFVFNVYDNIKFKPTFLAKLTSGAPVEFDFSANFLFNEKMWLGAMYRTGDAVGAIAQWIFDNGLRVGYAYDFSISQLRGMHFNTHEIMLSYELQIVKQAIVSPRYF